MKTHALVLAAGKGTRMKTALPKCAFPILKKPMIEYIIENVEKSRIDDIVVVVGHQKNVLVLPLKHFQKHLLQHRPRRIPNLRLTRLLFL